MSDPFDVLRSSGRGGPPDVGAIRSRARRIERRRRVVLSSSALLIVAASAAALLLRPTGRQGASTTVAQSTASPTLNAHTELRAAPVPRSPSAAAATSGAAGAPALEPYRPSPSPEYAPQAAARPAGGPADQSSGTLSLSVGAAGTGPHQEKFTLTACNPRSSSVEVTFPTGQRYDFEVTRSGAKVWQWSDGMAFTQMYGQETWAPNQCKSYDATWDAGTAQPGTYDVTGTLASSPRQSTPAKSFCLDVC